VELKEVAKQESIRRMVFAEDRCEGWHKEQIEDPCILLNFIKKKEVGVGRPS